MRLEKSMNNTLHRRGKLSDTILVNLLAGPGTGKSTIASSVFSELKWQGVNCELASEFAKDLCWEERFTTLTNQIYVFGKQLHRVQRLIDKVDVIITDSPLIFSVIYKPEYLSDNFSKLVLETFNQFNNMNYFLKRLKPYNPKGRMQTKDEAKLVDEIILNYLRDNQINYTHVNGNKDGVEIIVNDIMKNLSYRSDSND